MGEGSPAGREPAKRVSRRTSAAQDIIRATENARRTSAAAERIIGMTGVARLAGESIAKDHAERQARINSMMADVNKPERERAEREQRSIELTESLLEAQGAMAQSQAALVELERLRTEEARHDRNIQYAVLVLSALALVVGVIALFT